jgi:hypothetical protein
MYWAINRRFFKPIFAMNRSPIQRISCILIICSRFAAADVSAAVNFPAFAGILTGAVVSALPTVAGVPHC